MTQQAEQPSEPLAITVTAGPPTLFTSDPSLKAYKVPMRAYLDTNPAFDHVAVGALVFNKTPGHPDQDKLLILQRAPTDSFPLRWEVPGGAADFEDESLLHALAREMWEESGLRAGHIGVRLEPEDVFFTRKSYRVVKYSFLVDVDASRGDPGDRALESTAPGGPYEITLDPKEHTAFMWVTEAEARAKKCGEVDIEYTTQQQEAKIYEAFRLRKEAAVVIPTAA